MGADKKGVIIKLSDSPPANCPLRQDAPLISYDDLRSGLVK
jgi:hypothetical protein